MNKAYLLIGGNTGDRQKNLARAVNAIELKVGKLTKLSSLYETAAWGKTDQPNFYNQALEIETSFSAQQVLETVLEIELEMGRKRAEKFGPRIIDIDILFYGSEIIDIPHLKVPHPEVQNRRFALLPMVEIAGDFHHPKLKKTITVLLKECQDPLEAKKLVDSE